MANVPNENQEVENDMLDSIKGFTFSFVFFTVLGIIMLLIHIAIS